MSELEGQYNATQIEKRWYDEWVRAGIFTADPRSKKPPYVIVLPPPNVTGVLHMGHALTCTLEDILVRRKRMQGHEVLWIPGTDHAGIATQMVVERMLQKEQGKSRHDLGREKFLEEVWKWKETSQATILGQLKVLGCSLDWTRLRFTLDEGVSKAVRETFVRLHREGLLYRGEALIQWCPRCRTALSDLEVKYKEVRGKLYHIRYPLFEGSPRGIVVATTRPETLLGDTAIAVHPDDERFAEFHGKRVLVPFLHREIPIILDAYVDRTFGTGALKITPGHDPNDSVVGKRHGLEVITIFDEAAKLNEYAGPYAGLSREKARVKIVEDLEAKGLLVKQEDHTHSVGHCDRCDTVVEPRTSRQWFVNAEELAKDAMRAVREGKIRIIPEEWNKTYFQWMENIRPWCVSRQLWWGHRIPAWHCKKCANIMVATEAPAECAKCGVQALEQDADVLDTWFSSGLWPFSTLGWPDETEDYRAFYPNAVMETGFDILFFWVARMIMLGIKLTGKIPFHTVYLHPMVRDEQGQKMSKTKGNVKDPLEIVNRVGADPLRFTLAAMSVHGRDVLLSDSRIEGYRNFVNKIWNASRFVLMHFSGVRASNPRLEDPVNQWIWSRLEATKAQVNEALDQYRFFEAAEKLYHFLWSEYCDWYIELIKPEIETRKQAADSTAVEVLEQTLRLLHPVMPFVTEEIWQKLPVRDKLPSISVAPYPAHDASRAFPEAGRKLGRVVAIVEALRSKRGENQVPPGKIIHPVLVASRPILDEILGFKAALERLAASQLSVVEAAPGTLTSDSVVIPLDDVTILVPRDELIDPVAELTRVERELVGLRGELVRARQKLDNPDFIGRAPINVMEGVRARKDVLEAKVDALEKYLVTLKPKT